MCKKNQIPGYQYLTWNCHSYQFFGFAYHFHGYHVHNNDKCALNIKKQKHLSAL